MSRPSFKVFKVVVLRRHEFQRRADSADDILHEIRSPDYAPAGDVVDVEVARIEEGGTRCGDYVRWREADTGPGGVTGDRLGDRPGAPRPEDGSPEMCG